MKHDEHKHQCAFVRYIRMKYKDVLFSASVAGSVQMSVQQWKRATDSGYTKGFPDIVIYEPCGGYHGMAIEMKRKGGSVRSEQKNVLKMMCERGYCAVVCYGADEAIDALDKYMAGKIKTATKAEE